MKKNPIFILLIAAGILISSSCKKEDSKGDPVLEPISHNMDSYLFKTGTWWVYGLEGTQTFDTVTITGTESGEFWSELAINGSNGVKAAYYKMEIKSSASNTTGNYYVAFDYMRKNGGGYYGEFGQPILFSGHPQGYGFSGAKIDTIYSNFIVSLWPFFSVVKMKITSAEQYQTEYPKDTYLYFAPGFGLIRKDVIQDVGDVDVWLIKSYNIVN
jgi:hypothetical protein